MVDLYNEYLGEGMDLQEAVVRGTKERFRPILLTSLTTFLGVFPLIVETSLQAQFLIPLAVSIGYGVLFGTVIVIVCVPAVFVMQARITGMMQRLKNALAPQTGSTSEAYEQTPDLVAIAEPSSGEGRVAAE